MDVALGQKSPYGNSPLPAGHIRLLQIRPHSGAYDRPLECDLFAYPLVGSGGSGHGSHIYQALSYVWGTPAVGHDHPELIVNQCRLPVTANLHAALLSLRNHSLARIMWIDALCINQGDLTERAQQVQLMAEIYSNASIVIVWLGDDALPGTYPDDRAIVALETIRLAAQENREGSDIAITSPERETKKKPVEGLVLELLRRHWFKRIWVLQEVAAARHILIVCGSTEIDGYTFAVGLDSFSYSSHPDLEALIPSVAYLMREAIFRPRRMQRSHGRFSLGIRPLRELISMYHSREATLRADKIFALLGMTSDATIPEDLLPNYEVPWNRLFKSLVSFVLQAPTQLSIRTWDNCEVAVVALTATVVGQVKSVTSGPDRQDLDIALRNDLDNKDLKDERWTISVSTKPVRPGDVVVLMPGSEPLPVIIRPLGDYFSMITLPDTMPPALIRHREDAHQHLTCVWDWGETLPAVTQRGQDLETVLSRIDTERSVDDGDSEEYTQKIDRLENLALALEQLGRYEEATLRLRQVLVKHGETYGELHDLTLRALGKLAHVLRKDKQWEAAEQILQQQVSSRDKMLGLSHPDMLESLGSLATLYRDQDRSEDVARVEAMIEILSDDQPITADNAVRIASSFDDAVLRMLLARGGGSIEITEELISAAAGNEKTGVQAMQFLLSRRPDGLNITPAVVDTAVSNQRSGPGIIELLLKEGPVELTGSIIQRAASNKDSGQSVLQLLLEQEWSGREKFEVERQLIWSIARAKAGPDVMSVLIRAQDQVDLTQAAVVATVGLFDETLMACLIESRGGEVRLTEPFIKAATENPSTEKVIKLLLVHGGSSTTITKEIVKLVQDNGMQILLEAYGSDLTITADAIIEAVRSFSESTVKTIIQQTPWFGEDRMRERLLEAAIYRRSIDPEGLISLFLEQPWWHTSRITTSVLAAAARNWSGHKYLQLLFPLVDSHIGVTERMITAAADPGPPSMERNMNELLRRGARYMKITRRIMKVPSDSFEFKRVQFLLEYRLGDAESELEITNGAVAEIAEHGTKEMFKFLLSCRPDIPITEGVLAAAASNWRSGWDILKILLDQERSSSTRITHKVWEAAAAGNRLPSQSVMSLLMDRRPREFSISQSLVEAILSRWEPDDLKSLLIDRGVDEVELSKAIVQLLGTEYERFKYGKHLKTVLTSSVGRKLDLTTKGMIRALRYFDNRWTELLEVLELGPEGGG